MRRALVIDDDRSVGHLVTEALRDHDIEVITATSFSVGLAALKKGTIDVVLLDIMLPEMSGLELFEKVREIDAKVPIIFITASGSSDFAIAAMKMGAHDYLQKPLDVSVLCTPVEQALETRRLMNVPVELPDASSNNDRSDPLVGRSPQMLDVYKAIGRVASQDTTVLIFGESGTGKELIARAIYQHGARADRPFLAVNCAALPETLLESELFGHEKGAFTGADRKRIGKFEQCHTGTLFLDEIGDMSPMVQAKVLRILQQQQFERVGGNETIQVDVRIIAATNRDLTDMISTDAYRADLYFRLNGYEIRLPPLRERGDDVLLLIDLFLTRYSRELGKEKHTIAPDALELLTAYSWPGNIRELQNVIRKSMLSASGSVILVHHLPLEIRSHKKQATVAEGNDLPTSDLANFVDERLKGNSQDLYGETQAMMESYLLTRVLRLTGGNQSKAAAILGITRGSLRNKIHLHRISIGQTVSQEEEPLAETVPANDE